MSRISYPSLTTASDPLPLELPEPVSPSSPPRPRRPVQSTHRQTTRARPTSVPSGPSSLLTIEQVAKRCSVSERTARRWIQAGELRAHRLGHLVRVSEQDLAAFLAAHRDP